MALSLTCDCGARFEVEDALAGQTVSCPECQEPIKAPAALRPVRRTSGFALASFLLAVVGAFTVVGTAAAVVLGLVAVVLILRDRERLAGLGFASFGIGLGLVFTALTLWAVASTELFGLGSGFRRLQMADQLEPVDPKAPLELQENGFALTRPSPRWVKAKKGFSYILIDPILKPDALLLLVQPDLDAYADVQVEAGGRVAGFQDDLLNRLRQGAGQPAPPNNPTNNGPNPWGGEPEDGPTLLQVHDVRLVDTPRELPAEGTGAERVQECAVRFKIQNKEWTLLARAFQAADGRLYVVRAFTESVHYNRLKDELEKMLDSFHIAPGP